MNPRAPFLIFLLGCDVGADELTGLSETLITVASDEDVRVLEAKDDELVALLQELRDTITAQEVRIVDLEESCDLGLNGENYATREWVESLGSTNALLSNYVTVDEAESAIIFSGINGGRRSFRRLGRYRWVGLAAGSTHRGGGAKLPRPRPNPNLSYLKA